MSSSTSARLEGLSAAECEQALGTSIPTRMDMFDYYRALIRPDDRFYVQVTNAPFGLADKETVVRTVARLYRAGCRGRTPRGGYGRPLLRRRPRACFPLRYSEQHRAGLQLIFVSRVAR